MLNLLHAVPKCGEYNFNLSALANKTEYILKAELHLWLNIHSPTEQTAYIAGIKPVYADGREAKPVMRFFEIGNSDGYVVFEVNEMLRDLVAEGKYTTPNDIVS